MINACQLDMIHGDTLDIISYCSNIMYYATIYTDNASNVIF
jgi:hypothetical protein